MKTITGLIVNFSIYILRLRSGGLYVGACRDLTRRLTQHLKGEASRHTSLDVPIQLVYAEVHPTFVAARRREAQIKRWSRAKKEALISGDFALLKRLAKRKHA